MRNILPDQNYLDTLLLTGTYSKTVDNKSRLDIPDELYEPLSIYGTLDHCYVSGVKDGSIQIIPAFVLKRFDRLEYKNYYFSRIVSRHRINLDKQFKDKHVTLIGEGDRILVRI